MNLIECKSLADVPLNEPLEPYPEAWGWTLEKAIIEYRRRHNQEPKNVYHIFNEYRFSLPEEARMNTQQKECSTCVFGTLSLDDFPCNKCDSDYSEFANHETIAQLQSQLDEAREEITASRNFIEDILGHATKSQLRVISPFHAKYRSTLNGGKNG